MEPQPRFRSLIINIRGTNASGKSEIMRKLLKLFGSTVLRDKKGRIIGYDVHFEPRFVILGDYSDLLGGCDSYPSMEAICRAVKEFSKQRDVLFEGILVSLLTAPWVELAGSLPQSDFIFATLDTPLDVCLERREKRWLQEGHTGNFNPKHMIEKFYAVRKAHKRLKAAHLNTRWLNYEYTTQTIINWLLAGRFAADGQ